MLIEIVREESDDSILEFANMIPEDIERCNCGSSLARVVGEEIPKGREYNVICAKCGGHIFGFTDNFDVRKPDYVKTIREHVEKLLSSHQRNKLDEETLRKLTKDEKSPKSLEAYWQGYSEGVSYGYDAVIKFIKLMEKAHAKDCESEEGSF